jgi:hypothetical protein
VSSVRRRRLTAISLAVVAGLTLSACGTNFGAQTNQVYQPAVGANERGDVETHNTLLVVNRDGSATLSAGLVNTLDDEQTVTGVTVATKDGESLTVRRPKGSFKLPPGQLVSLGGKDASGVFVVTEGAEPGAYVDLTISFSGSSPLTVEAPVVARSEHAEEYADVAGGDGLVPNAVSGTDSAE